MLVNHQNVLDLGSANNVIFWYTMYIRRLFCCLFFLWFILIQILVRYYVYADRITLKYFLVEAAEIENSCFTTSA